MSTNELIEFWALVVNSSVWLTSDGGPVHIVIGSVSIAAAVLTAFFAVRRNRRAS